MLKSGAGQLTINSTASVSGPTDVLDGSLVVNGTLPSANQSVRLHEDAILGGSGRVPEIPGKGRSHRGIVPGF